MELSHLRYFAAIAEERHFGRAAKRLQIAQPPLSRRLQAMEKELGFMLFDRARRELTEPGRVLYAHAKKLFEAFDRGLAEAKRVSIGESGKLVIGYPSSLAYSGLSEVLRTFREAFPGVEVSLREMPPQDQIDALKEGRLDVGFVREPAIDPELEIHRVRQEPLAVALPTGHPLARRGRVPLEALRNEPFVFFPRPRGHTFYDHLMKLCHQAGFTPRVVQEAPQLDLVSLVAAGFGVALVPYSLHMLRRDGVTFRRLEGDAATDLALVWRAGDPSPSLRQFTELVRRIGVRARR